MPRLLIAFLAPAEGCAATPAVAPDPLDRTRAEKRRYRDPPAAANAELERLREARCAAATHDDPVGAKNNVHVALGREILAAYGKRYRRSRHDPRRRGRARFLAAAQDNGDRIYDDRCDVAEPRRSATAGP